MDFTVLQDIWRRYEATEISREIHPADDMWSSGKDWYWSVGTSAIRVIVSFLSFTWNDRVRRILDLPSGYGRVGRHLATAFPDATRFYCDLDAEAAEFCARWFSGEAIPSKPELTEVALPGNFDLIWVGSLFTHFDRERSQRWLAFLAEHLSDHGLLVATFHGRWTLETEKASRTQEPWRTAIAQYEATGYGYAPYPSSQCLGDYGVSVSRASTVVEMASNIDGVRIAGYFERGWADNHDVLAITRNDRLRRFPDVTASPQAAV